MESKLKWGILGCGGIANAFAKGVAQTDSGVIAAVASRDIAKAKKFAETYGIEKAYGSYDALLEDKSIDAVYISTPHPMHAQWAIRAADSGKHILCEKPIALTHADAMTIVEAARRNHVFLMEAFMYRCNPQTKRLAELIKERVIGDVQLIKASFSFRCGGEPESRLMKNALGGGGILDVGCYPVSMARLVAGAATGKDFANPVDVQAAGRLGETGVDEWTVATLRFEGDIFAQVSTGVRMNDENTVTILGTEGKIIVPSPWFCNGGQKGQGLIRVQRYEEKSVREVTVDVPKGIYAVEADTVAQNLEACQAPSPAMSWNDTLGNMRTLDQWRKAIGLVYEGETAEAYALPLDKRPLTVKKDSPMKYGKIEGLNKKVSRLVMGVDNQGTISHATAMFDDYFARGGNCFDTAFVYGNETARLLGQWIKNRNLRQQVNVICKGAHTPECFPHIIKPQLEKSLENLQTGYTDIYFMHRDNPEVPAGEFIDALNELCDAGKIFAFGGSNWSGERVDEANAYAKKHGKRGFCAISNNFSLAQMLSSVWGGCIASSTPDMQKWHQGRQMPLFAWSSQARGFFVPGLAFPEKQDNAELVRCWYSPENFERQRRAFELAKKKNVRPINIALAYVLHQSFPVFALIGPRLISETVDSFEALNVDLAPEEMQWLNLEDGKGPGSGPADRKNKREKALA